MQKARRRALALRPLVNERVQVLFHSPPGVLFNFPSRYWSTIGLPEVFSLAGWSPRIPTEFHVLRRTQDTIKSLHHFAYKTITFYGLASQLIQL